MQEPKCAGFDSFPTHEVYIGFKDGANPDPGWNSGSYWPVTPGDAEHGPWSVEGEERLPYRPRYRDAEEFAQFLELSFEVDGTPRDKPTGVYESIESLSERRQERTNLSHDPDFLNAVDAERAREGLGPLPKVPGAFRCEKCGVEVSVAKVLDHHCELSQEETVTAEVTQIAERINARLDEHDRRSDARWAEFKADVTKVLTDVALGVYRLTGDPALAGRVVDALIESARVDDEGERMNEAA
jgi:hypothetical protein